jgi:hypothetical protein
MIFYKSRILTLIIGTLAILSLTMIYIYTKSSVNQVQHVNTNLLNSKIACPPKTKIIIYEDNSQYKSHQLNWEYLKGFTKEEIRFAETEIYPKLKTSEEYVKAYLEAMRCEDKLLAKLLQGEDFPSIKYNKFLERLEKNYSILSNKEYSNLRRCMPKAEKNNCVQTFFFEIDNKKFQIESGYDFSSNKGVYKPTWLKNCSEVNSFCLE